MKLLFSCAWPLCSNNKMKQIFGAVKFFPQKTGSWLHSLLDTIASLHSGVMSANACYIYSLHT